jgi:hypothetical protein
MQHRIRPVLGLVGVLVTACSLILLRFAQPADSPGQRSLRSTAAAYRSLATALQDAGLVPFPADEAGTARLRSNLALDPQQWRPSITSGGQKTWRLGDGVVLQCSPAGGVERCFLILAGRAALRNEQLRNALAALGELGESAQRPTSGVQAPLPGLEEQPFFFDYQMDSITLRLTPGFGSGVCRQIAIEQP